MAKNKSVRIMKTQSIKKSNKYITVYTCMHEISNRNYFDN